MLFPPGTSRHSPTPRGELWGAGATAHEFYTLVFVIRWVFHHVAVSHVMGERVVTLQAVSGRRATNPPAPPICICICMGLRCDYVRLHSCK